MAVTDERTEAIWDDVRDGAKRGRFFASWLEKIAVDVLV